jgi:hypothetical protein
MNKINEIWLTYDLILVYEGNSYKNLVSGS